MSNKFPSRLLILAACALWLMHGVPAPGQTPATTQPAQLLPWLDTLDAAYDDAQKNHRPIFAIVGATWCPPCHRLHEELATPTAQRAMGGWTLLYLDADASAPAVRKLGIGTLPALRILSPMGEVLASTEGFMKADELAAWLADGAKKALPQTADNAADSAPPDEKTIARLIDSLSKPGTMERELAARRLLPHPEIAAVPLVDAFAFGRLSYRLAALEILQAWHAPVEGIDPWQPDTITPARLDQLRAWARQSHVPATRASQLDAGDLALARQEIDRLLASRDETDALAIRERLARFGPALRPEILARLKTAATQMDRQRLTALRYRLAATEKMAQEWPWGLDNLASGDETRRRAALAELTQRATAADTPLLLELFTDADPLVRESSLRLLAALGGGSGSSLAALLKDPDSNVRAAVLKELVRQPDPKMNSAVEQYAKTETDPDLVVYAVRVLREAKTESAKQCLVALLSHSNWRVRGEAAEALSYLAGRGTIDNDIGEVLIKCLDDPDSFVVSQAAVALTKTNMKSAVDPMLDAVGRHPEMAPEVIRAIVNSNELKSRAKRGLRKLCANADPTARAAAIKGLCEVDADNAAPELKAALKDPVKSVRLAATQALLSLMINDRPADEYAEHSTLLGLSQAMRRTDLDGWLKRWRDGADRPDWAAVVPELTAMFKSADAEGQMNSGICLIALGQDGIALPTVERLAKTEHSLREMAAGALPWLPWEKWLELYNELIKLPLSDQQIELTAKDFALIPDPRADNLLWQVLATPDAEALQRAKRLSTPMLRIFQQYYFCDSYHPAQRLAASDLKTAVDAITPRASGGAELQRRIALVLLVQIAPDTAAKTVATQIYADPKASAELKADALQIKLITSDRKEAAHDAQTALASPSAADRLIALEYLSSPAGMLSELDGLYLNYNFPDEDSDPTGQIINVNAPAGLKAEAVKPLLKDSDPLVAALAGYVLATTGDRSGIDAVINYWRAHQTDTWQRLTWRAIAACNDDSKTPVLEEIYGQMKDDRWAARPFYWTIRSMDGPNVLKLRKRIRDEIGMDNLR